MKKNVNSRPKCMGEITAKCYDQSKLGILSKLWNKTIIALGMDRGLYIFGPLKWEKTKRNVVCNVGFEALGEILTGDYVSTGQATHAALGTGLTAVSASDTTLTTETYRNTVFSGTASGNITYLTAVYTEAEVTGTFEEFGFFIDGTGTVDTGVLWNHVLTGGWVKTGVDALVVDGKFTWTS